MASHPQLRTQAALARRTGVAQSTISRMMRGEGDPQSESLRLVFEALEIPGNTFVHRAPDGELGTPPAAPVPTRDFRQVPLISLVQAGAFGETVDPYPPGEGQRWLVCPVRCGPKTFALTVTGESMEPRYHAGDVIYVDPEVPETQGSLVVVRLQDSNEATFKQLVIEGSRRYVKPLNTRFPITEITAEARIVGVVVGGTWEKT